MLYQIFGSLTAQRLENNRKYRHAAEKDLWVITSQAENDQQNQFTAEIIYMQGKHHNETHKYFIHCLSDI